ncbi:DUF3373 family protein [Hydrogenimonas sp.]
MKKLIAISVVAAMAASMSFASDVDELKAQLEALKKEVAALKKQTKGLHAKKLKKQISELKSAALQDNLKWNVDLRTSFDMIEYKHVSGEKETKNDLLSNRLWLGMKYAPTSNISFFGQLSYNKMFGESQSAQRGGYNYFDWIANENATDGDLKVRQAYFVYFGDKFLGANVPWTASLGRRPSTNGLLVNLRDDDPAQSPLGHIINVEFDGASLGFDLSNVTDVSGMYFKICAGRGFSNAKPRFSTTDGTAYTTDETVTPDNDLLGFIFKPYDDGQYSIWTTYFYAWNLLGYTNNQVGGMQWQMLTNAGLSVTPMFDPTADGTGFNATGGMHGWAVSVKADGVGDGINDFLDDTILFFSYAGNKTDPKDDQTMLTSAVEYVPTSMTTGNLIIDEDELGKSHTGWSIYMGAQFPALFTDDGRIGIEYNHGSEYWRSFTYAEDTMVGSKLAARGDAYEVYYTQPLVGKTLTAQVRYTYIDYKYDGSQAFFGADGNAQELDDVTDQEIAMGYDPVDKAQDLRFYIRYRY